ncbi:ABC-type lipoprotein release transport system permease subunit [Agromyces flavus]|uniref:ABC-type lipoprotein release transport system permease subunit n=1 Tax=Agromyces flavus TaxID=589382 RepID=A0A1H1X2R5_9MICO|nr:FtsX-like permease family protein [Agromyces flavus]MCP2366319.1 ABC-type lipoprotein release transport system permease subunit [Agromyces flavus]GGI44436.1 membrane protein [Agromyces flavus]SDT03645.1 ABC-type transport system, involved in lipoprotein release, permease component [Agromyces flavus]
MFFTYLRRELAGRRRQTAIIAIGMALAIALVMIVNAVSAGVRDAQAAVLESVYGVGTDLTVSQAPAAPGEGEGPGGGVRFEFGQDDGATGSDGSTTELSNSRLTAGPGSSTFDASALDTVQEVDGVAAASATLSLTNVTFDGELPAPPTDGGDGTDGDATMPAPGEGGSRSFGGGAFDVASTSVTGIDPAADAVGPLSAVELVDGRGLDADDAGEYVVVLDEAYATTEGLAVGDTIDLGGTEFEVVGTVASTSADASTASDAYIPLDVAQELSGLDGQVSDIAVQAESADVISSVKSDLEAALPDQQVSTQEELAASVSGSLGSASRLISSLGLWLSVAVLAAAFLIAILFTIQGVTRRTREFGTLKAIGWSNRRIVGQVTGESLVQGLIGGAAGLVLGFTGIAIVNAIAPTLATTAAPQVAAEGPMGGGFAGGANPFDAAQASSEVVLTAPVTISVVAIAVGLALLGGLLAGAIGGWRASRLRPAEALRSVA